LDALRYEACTATLCTCLTHMGGMVTLLRDHAHRTLLDLSG
jgi:hypothetical protein